MVVVRVGPVLLPFLLLLPSPITVPLVAYRYDPSPCYRQIKKAYCPPEVVEANPILDYCKHLLFAWSGEVNYLHITHGTQQVEQEIIRKKNETRKTER